jgi:hypothetical protein
MKELFEQIEDQLEQLAKEFVKTHERHTDPLKAATIRQETLETFSATLNQRVQAKGLFMYANQQGEMLKAQLYDDQCISSDQAFIQAKRWCK